MVQLLFQNSLMCQNKINCQQLANNIKWAIQLSVNQQTTLLKNFIVQVVSNVKFLAGPKFWCKVPLYYNNLNTEILKTVNEGNKKVKAVLLQAWCGPEGSRKLGFPDFMTTAQDGGKVVSLMHRPPLPTGNTPGIHFC